MSTSTKGKNYTAAEKHFEKERMKYLARIKELESQNAILNSTIRILKEQNRELTTQNESLNDWVDRLLKYTELPKGDIKAICEKDKKNADAMETIAGLLKIPTNNFYY